MTHHFLALDGAATLATEHLLLTRRAVRDAIERCAMAVIHGEAGLGKTFAVEDLVAGTKEPVLWTSFPSRPTPRLVAADLLERLSGRSGRRDRFAIVAELVDRLTQGPRLLVVDESQLLTGDCIELLRYLHDDRRTHFALVLVGGHGTWQVLSREPMLASRVFRRVCFAPLSRPQVLEAIPAYHSVYADCDPDLIGDIDDVFAHGNLRNWAAFTLSARQLAQEHGRLRLDKQIVANVYALHGGGGPNR